MTYCHATIPIATRAVTAISVRMENLSLRIGTSNVGKSEPNKVRHNLVRTRKYVYKTDGLEHSAFMALLGDGILTTPRRATPNGCK